MEDAPPPPPPPTTLALLTASLQDLTLPSDSVLSLRDCVTTAPWQSPPFFPQALPASFFNPLLLKKHDADTLFWIFYYQQGTPQQLYASHELKKGFWRYHSRFRTWFQRHPRELPTEITQEWEKGTYVFFDEEKGWCDRVRSDFLFEYAFLAD